MSKKSDKVKQMFPQDNVDAKNKPSAEIEAALAGFLSGTYVLAVQTLGCHWNVTGANFASLHKLFEEQYKELLEASDELAERVRALGYVAPASLAEFADNSSIEDESTPEGSNGMLKLLHKNHVALSEQAAKVLKTAQASEDEATADIIIGRIKAHDKAAWMLGALLAE